MDVPSAGKADGSLHEVTALALATVPLKALKERNNLGVDVVDGAVLLTIGRLPRLGAVPVTRGSIADIGVKPVVERHERAGRDLDLGDRGDRQADHGRRRHQGRRHHLSQGSVLNPSLPRQSGL